MMVQDPIGSESIGWVIQRMFKEQDGIQTLIEKMIFKATFDKKIHLISLKNTQTIDELRKAIALSFKLPADSFEMSYLDQEGDLITLQDAQDFSILTSSGLKTMKIRIQQLKSDSEPSLLGDCESVKNQPIEAIEPLRTENTNNEITAKKVQVIQERVQVKEEKVQVKEELIEEKFRKYLPEIISKVKTEIEEEISERSRIIGNNQPIITEDDDQKPILAESSQKKEQPEIPREEKKKPVIHKGVTCDGCRKPDIQGVRYKCAVCPNFDFCQQCESSQEHSHPFLKIKNLQQTPIKVVAVIRDEEDNLEINGHKLPSNCGIDNLINKGMCFLNGFFNGQRGERRQRNCPMFRNKCQRQQKRSQEKCYKERGCEEKCYKEQCKEEKPKMEEKKTEPKEEKKKQESGFESNQEKIIENARYLSELGIQFDKCYRWACTYPEFSKQQFVNFCLTTPGFLN